MEKMELKLKTSIVKMVESSDWDRFVSQVYNRPYCLQQQDGCKSRGTETLIVPSPDYDEFMPDDVPEIVNGSVMGVKFAQWISRDPKEPLKDQDDKSETSLFLWWERNFYPDLNAVANDLHSRGLLESGEYVINVDW